MRSTIKREAAAMARYPKNYKTKKGSLPDILPWRLGTLQELTSWRTVSTFGPWSIRWHMKQIWDTRTSQLYGVVTSIPYRANTKLSTEAMRVVE